MSGPRRGGRRGNAVRRGKRRRKCNARRAYNARRARHRWERLRRRRRRRRLLRRRWRVSRRRRRWLRLRSPGHGLTETGVRSGNGLITVTYTVPTTTIDSGPSGTINSACPTFTFSANEAGSTFECKLDGGSFSSCSSPKLLGPLADGPHTFEVRATNASNNTGPAASRSFTVDTTAPTTTIDSGPSGTTENASPTFTFSANEAGSTFECKLDDGSFSSCSSPKLLGPLADGPHTFEVRATDASNNTGPAASRSFTVDTTAPTTTIDSGPSGTTQNASPTFTFSANEPGSSFECELDGGSFNPCSSPKLLGPLTDGPHTFEVRATDQSDNTGPAASRSFTVDTAPPPDPPPVITDFRVTPQQFVASGESDPLERAAGGTIELTLSEDATVRFRLRREPPDRSGGPPPKNPRTFTRQLEEGANSVPFTGTLGERTLKPRRYTLRARARDSADQRSEWVSTKFRVKKPD